MDEKPIKPLFEEVFFDTSEDFMGKVEPVTYKNLIKNYRKRQREIHKRLSEIHKRIYRDTPVEKRPHRIAQPYTIVQAYNGKNVRIRMKNKAHYLGRQATKRKRILHQPHNSDMSTEPINYLDETPQEYMSTDENLPKAARPIKAGVTDIEPAWRNPNPKKRMSWPEFCRDFIGQNYGAIAQDMLEMHASDDPSMKVQFLKFIMEMGKQGNPQAMNIDVNAQTHVTTDVYAALSAMANMGEIQTAETPIYLEQQEPDLAEEEPNYEV